MNFFPTINKKISTLLKIFLGVTGVAIMVYSVILPATSCKKNNNDSPTADGALSAAVNGYVVKGDSTAKASIVVTSHNGASLQSLSIPTEPDFITDSNWTLSNNTATLGVWSTQNGSPVSTDFDISSPLGVVKAYVGVAPPSPSKSLSATIDNEIKEGDPSVVATISVTSYNGASLYDLSIPAEEGLATSNNWTIRYNVATLNIWSLPNSSPEANTFVITGSDAYASVYVGVMPSNPVKALSAYASGNVKAGDPSVKVLIVVTNYNGASLSNLSKPTADGFATDASWTVQTTYAQIYIWSTTGSSPVGTEFTITGPDASTNVYIGVIPLAPAPTLAAVIDGEVKSGDSSVKPLITVTSYNNASLTGLSIPTGTGFATEAAWYVNWNTATLHIWSTDGGAPTGTKFTITGSDASTSVFVGVIPPSPLKSLSATVDGEVKSGDSSVKPLITVTSYNNASLTGLSKPTGNGFATDANWIVSGNTATIYIWSTQGGTPVGTQFTITGSDASTSVFVGVSEPNVVKSISATINGAVKAGDPSVKPLITVTSYNGASLSNLSRLSGVGFATNGSWTVSGNTATINIWSVTSATPVGTLFAINGPDASTSVYVSVIPSLNFAVNVNAPHGVCNIYQENSSTKIAELDCINLKTLSNDNDGITNFAINGTVQRPIFIPADFSCSLIGNDGSSLTPSSINLGIIIGHDVPNQAPKNASVFISKVNINFPASSSNGTRSIVVFSSIIGRLDIIDNIFTSYKNGTGIDFFSPVKGKISIGNNYFYFNNISYCEGIKFEADVASNSFNIYGNTFITSGYLMLSFYGIYFFSTITNDSQAQFFINKNTFNVSDCNTIYGLYFFSNADYINISNNDFSFLNGAQASAIFFADTFLSQISYIAIRNNNILISSDVNYSDSGYGIYFSSFSSSQIIVSENNISISVTSSAIGINFYSGKDISLINNTITINSSYSWSPGAYCVYFDGSLAGANTFSLNVFILYSLSTQSNPSAVYVGQLSDSLIFLNNVILVDTLTTRVTSSFHIDSFSETSELLTLYNNSIFSTSRGGDIVGVSLGSTFSPQLVVNIMDNFISTISRTNTYSYGIATINLTVPAARTVFNFNNNTISVFGGNSSYGIDIQNSSFKFAFNNNTISTNVASGISYGIYFTSTPSEVPAGTNNVVFSIVTTTFDEHGGPWAQISTNYKTILAPNSGNFEHIDTSVTINGGSAKFSLFSFKGDANGTTAYMEAKIKTMLYYLESNVDTGSIYYIILSNLYSATFNTNPW